MRSSAVIANRVWRQGAVLALLLASQAGAQPLTVRHICPESDTDARNQHFIQLLDLVLSKTEGPYRLAVSRTNMPQGRALVQLKKGEDLDVVWTMTSADRERELLPIRIPLLKGLIGVRLLLIHREDTARFAHIATADHLRSLHAGQGHDWPDTAILEHNGYRVTGKTSYDALFRMLAKHRIDYFPRSVEEVWSEAAQHAARGLVVEPHLVLHYPAAIYFFVKKDNRALAARLEEGLRRALADGSFDALFYSRFNAVIEQARLDERTRIDLVNPLLPSETPLDKPNLWYRF